MITPQEIADSIAFTYSIANQWDLGEHRFGEVEKRGADGKDYIINLFAGGGVVTEKGHYGPGDAKFFDRKTFAISDKPPVVVPPVVNPPPTTGYPFDPTKAIAPAYLEQGTPLTGKAFYRAVGMTVQQGVGAYCYVTVLDKGGSPQIGAKVINQFLNSQNGECVITDGTGVAKFQFGTGSSVPDPATGHYPFSFAVTLDGYKDYDAKVLHVGTILSDWVRGIGDYAAEHTQVNIQFRQIQ